MVGGGHHIVQQACPLEELERQEDHHTAGPDLAAPDADVVEEARVAVAEEGFDDAPAIQARDGEQLESEDRKVQKDDRIDEKPERLGRYLVRAPQADSVENAPDRAE